MPSLNSTVQLKNTAMWLNTTPLWIAAARVTRVTNGCKKITGKKDEKRESDLTRFSNKYWQCFLCSTTAGNMKWNSQQKARLRAKKVLANMVDGLWSMWMGGRRESRSNVLFNACVCWLQHVCYLFDIWLRFVIDAYSSLILSHVCVCVCIKACGCWRWIPQ